MIQGFPTTGKTCKDPIMPCKHLQCTFYYFLPLFFHIFSSLQIAYHLPSVDQNFFSHTPLCFRLHLTLQEKSTYHKVASRNMCVLFRKSSSWGCYKPRHVTKRDMILFIKVKNVFQITLLPHLFSKKK